MGPSLELGASWFDEVIPAEVRDDARAAFERLVHSGEAVEHYEAEVVTRRGRHRRIAWQATALVDAKGRMVAVLSGQDITDRLTASCREVDPTSTDEMMQYAHAADVVEGEAHAQTNRTS